MDERVRMLESLVASGSATLDHAMALARAYVNAGEIEKASTMLGEFAVSHVDAYQAIRHEHPWFNLAEVLGLPIPMEEIDFIADIASQMHITIPALLAIRVSHETGPRFAWHGGHLNSVDISGLALASLPSSIEALSHVRIFDAADNELTELPPEIGGMSMLEIFFLQNNRLVELPIRMIELVRLRTLFLQGNRLRALYPHIDAMVGLYVYIDGNPVLKDTALIDELNAQGVHVMANPN